MGVICAIFTRCRQAVFKYPPPNISSEVIRQGRGKGKAKIMFAQNDFVFGGMNYWTRLLPDIQNAQSLDCFKNKLKKNAHVFPHIT